MEEITLCLRQEDSVQVDRNGVYTTTLSHPVELRDGDVVSIKSVFLDTQDVISVPVEGLPIELRGCKYLVNYNINQDMLYRASNPVHDNAVGALCTYKPTSQPMTYEGVKYDDPTQLIPITTTTGDNTLYWLADAVTSTAAGNPYFIVNVNVEPLTKGRGGARYGGCSVVLQYTSKDAPAGTLFDQYTTVKIPSYQEDESAKHPLVPVPSQAHKRFPSQFVSVTCKSINGKPSIQHYDGDPTLLDRYNIAGFKFPVAKYPPNQPITAAADMPQIIPQYFTWTATIPGGDYTPVEIAGWLTDNLVPVEYSSGSSANYNFNPADGTDTWSGQTKFPSESPFLETILQNYQTTIAKNAAGETHVPVLVNASKADPTDPTILDAEYAGVQCREFAFNAMVGDYEISPFNPPVDRWIGTDQLSMSFDETENKLKFDIMHFPVYTAGTFDPTTGAPLSDAKPGVQYNELQNTAPATAPFDPSFPGNVGNLRVNGNSGLAKAYSGIAFTAMTPASFWSDQLGFDDMCINVQENTATSYYPTYDQAKAYVNNSFTIDNVLKGQTITEGLASISVPVVTSSGPQYGAGATAGPNGAFARPIFDAGVAGAGVGVQIADVSAIFADRIYNQTAGGAGFFLIDIANNFNMDFVSENTRSQMSNTSINGKDTMSIVSRYYTSNNFVSDQGGGSIVYTHSGANRLLTELAVRVKNPDGTFLDPVVLGNKNSVFLQIKRAIPILTGGQPPAGYPQPVPPKE